MKSESEIVLFVVVLIMVALSFAGVASYGLSAGTIESSFMQSILKVLSRADFYGREQVIFFLPAYVAFPMTLSVWVFHPKSSFSFSLGVQYTYIGCLIIVVGIYVTPSLDDVWKFSLTDALLFLFGAMILNGMAKYVSGEKVCTYGLKD